MKHALITGATRGLGAALASQLEAKGVRVTRVARSLGYDVSKKDDIHRIVGESVAVNGPVDLLVNNASTLGPLPMPLLLDLECEDLEDVLATNLVGPFRLAKAVLGNMVLRGNGTVVNISSDAASGGYPHWGAYGASKAALDLITKTWAAELEETGVRILSIDPGEMDTQMHRDALPDADPTPLRRPADVAREIIEKVFS